ncbi:MAG: hypothetical protein M3347_03380 [Armatimonadota bacterium]|nr:hypothetical protein [Armatimonadota bacterium]
MNLTDETPQSLTSTPQSAEPSAPLCAHLRSKRMYVENSFEAEAQADENVTSAYGHYWCLQTMYEIGPDDERVHRKACKPGRSCYEPG